MRHFLANAMRRADEEREARLAATRGKALPCETATAHGADGEMVDPETAAIQTLGLVARNGCVTVATVAEEFGLTPSTAHRRLHRLTEAGRLAVKREGGLYTPARWVLP